MTARVTREFRGITKRAAIMYLEHLGGEAVEDDRVAGDGWTATVSGDSVGVGPTLRVDRVTVEFEGDADRLSAILERFRRKAMRSGG
ncbi:MAG: hypothetical protein ACLFM8_06500 [Halobacteriales archaeon]